MFVKDILASNRKTPTTAKVNELGLELFKSVLRVNDDEGYTITDGFSIPNSAGDVVSDVRNYVKENVITNDKMRQTFLKSWTQDSTYWEAMVAYIGGVYSLGYGSVGTHTFPADVVNGVPQGTKLFIVGVMTPSEFAEKVLNIFASGIAMKQETIEKMFDLLDALGYKWDGNEVIKNKEAALLIADRYDILPKNGDTFLRYLIFKATESTLLIKSPEVITALKSFNAYEHFKNYKNVYGNFNKLAEVFLRHKALFLALKRGTTASYINKISKLAKTLHKPMPTNPMNNLAYERVTFEDLDKATTFAIFRALNYCYNRLFDFGDERALTYKIRNGKIKTVVKKSDAFVGNSILKANQTTIVSYIQKNMGDLVRGKNVFIPEGVKYALPTSEKKMMGGVPFGTRIVSVERLCAGIYWRNEWGARDFDLSAVTPTERIGWNSKWMGSLKYSGDITNAPSGASEYIVNTDALYEPVLLLNNRFSGQPNAEYQISIGKSSDASLDGNGFMMSEDKMIFQSPRVKSESKEMCVGAFVPSVDKSGIYEYVVFNLRGGSARVSSDAKSVELKSIVQEYSKQVTIEWLLRMLGAEFVTDVSDADFDLTPSNLTATTLVDLFSK